MLEGKALVVAIMMLTAAPLVVTDDGRAIVGDVTSDVTDMFTVEEAAEDPKLNELLDDAVDKSELSESEKERKQAEVVATEEEKECYFLDEAKEMMGDKEGKDWDKEEKDWDKEDKDWDKEGKDEWESEEDFEAYLEKLSQDCEEGVEESCEELEVIREKMADREDEQSEEESEDESSEEEERSRSGDAESEEESEEKTEEDYEKEEFDEEFMAQMEELKVACDEGDEEACREAREMMAELMEDRVEKEDGKEKKDFEDACLTMEEWKSVLDEDKKGKERHYHKEDRREINFEVMMEMFYEADEEEVAELKQAMEMSDEEWNQMIVKLETDNMTEEDWMMVMEKVELLFESERAEELQEMEAFRAQMKEFDDACEAGNETACEELEAMMAEVEEDFREDKEGCDKEDESEEEYEEESEEESEEDESEEDESDDDESDEELE